VSEPLSWEAPIRMLPPALVTILGAAGLTSLHSYVFIRRQESSRLRCLLAIPVVTLYLFLPVLVYDYRTATIPSALVGCIFSWVASFKVLMLVFRRGPLADPAVATNLIRFSAILCAPVNLKPSFRKLQEKESSSKLLGQSVLKVAILLITVRVVDAKESLHPQVYHLFCYINLYLFASLVMDVFAAATSWALGIELLPDFNRPFLSQSLSEFWARRWNLTVSAILKGAVYEPLLERITGRLYMNGPAQQGLVGLKDDTQHPMVDDKDSDANGKYSSRQEDKVCRTLSRITNGTPLRAKMLPVLATFAVSGIMHELAFWYLSHTVTGEMVAFFTLHGLAVVAERWIGLSYPTAFKTSKLVATGMTMAFCFVTSEWLFLPPLYRAGVDVRVILELKKALFID
jgi:hypothetical protein